MRQVFKFSHFDYLFPLSEQCRQIRRLKQSKEILEYSVSAILAAQPVVKEIQTIHDRKLKTLLESNHSINLENPNLWSFQASMAQVPQANSEEFSESILKSSKDSLSDSIQTFEDLWKVINYYKCESTSRENMKWIKTQTEKLILDNKLNLSYLALIYRDLSEYNSYHNKLREFYDELIINYIHNFLPAELTMILKAFSRIKLIEKNHFNWLSIVKDKIEGFATLPIGQVSSIVFSLNLIGIKVGFPKLKAAVKDSDLVDPYVLYYLITANKFNYTEQSFKGLLSKMTIDSQIDLMEILDFVKLNEKYFQVLVEFISSTKCKIEIQKLYIISNILLRRTQYLPYLYSMIQAYTPQIHLLTLYEYGRYLEILCMLKSADFIIPNDALEIIKARFYEFKDEICSTNLQTIVHFFTYAYPVKAIHRIICDKILENEHEDSLEKYAVDHIYHYANGEGLYVTFNNHLLRELTFTSLVDILLCLPFRFQVRRDVYKIVKKYLKLIIIKFNYRIKVKFGSKIAIMLSAPENFDRELVKLFLDKIYINKTMVKTMSNSYPFMQAVNNFKNIQYEHPLFSILPNSSHTQDKEDI